MRVEKLRKGNLVWENYGGVYIVRGLPVSGDITISKTESTICVDFNPNDIKPIPLTEEWFDKFMFEKSLQHSWFKKMRKNTVFIVNYKDEFKLFISSGVPIFIRTVKYVDELQNFWFSNSGEELTLKQ